MDLKKIIAGAVSGFVAAFAVDMNAWAKAKGAAFDWMLAFKRWVSGATTGALAALGMGQI